MINQSRQEKIEALRAKDRLLIEELAQRIQRRTSPPKEIWALLQGTGDFTLEQVEKIEEALVTHGAFDVVTLRVPWQDAEGNQSETLLPRGTVTDMWPMGTNWWTRDHTLIAARLLEAGSSRLMQAKQYGELGQELLLSALTIFATRHQLGRFQRVIESRDDQFIHQRENWPQIFLTIKDNLNGVRAESWAHKQDAWQMLAYHTLRAIERGDLSREKLSANHKQFLAYVLPFLAKIQFWQEEGSGSWEELVARRSSVMAWELAAVDKIASFAKRPDGKFLIEGFEAVKQQLPLEYRKLGIFQVAENLIAKGKEALLARLPYESPDYEKTDPRYREADAALIYLLQLGMPEFLGQPDLEEKLVAQIERLTDVRTGAIRRYLNDSYQGKSFFRNEIAFYMAEMYGTLSSDTSDTEHWIGRRRVVPAGPEAGWTHFVWQMSAWAGRRYQETGEKKYWDMQQHYFRRALKLITGEGEASIDLGKKGQARVINLLAWRIPEAYLSDEGPNGEDLVFPSPHTPLNWAVGEAIHALAMMKQSLGTYYG